MKPRTEHDSVLYPQDSMGGSPNDIRISDMRPTLVEPPMYKPKVVLLGKDKKGMESWRQMCFCRHMELIHCFKVDHVAAVSTN